MMMENGRACLPAGVVPGQNALHPIHHLLAPSSRTGGLAFLSVSHILSHTLAVSLVTSTAHLVARSPHPIHPPSRGVTLPPASARGHRSPLTLAAAHARTPRRPLRDPRPGVAKARVTESAKPPAHRFPFAHTHHSLSPYSTSSHAATTGMSQVTNSPPSHAC